MTSNPTEGWFDRLMETTADHAVILTAPDGTILEWLGAAERVFGYSSDEMKGRPFSTIFTPEDLATGLDRHEIEVALATGKSEDDRWHLRKGGGRFWATGVLTVLPAKDDRPLILCKMVRDRTDARSHIEALQNEVVARMAEIEQRKQFFAVTVHELTNPLNPMVMALELLGRSAPAGPTTPALRILRNQLRVVTALVADLSRAIDVGSAEALLQRERVGLGEALRTLVDSLVPTAEAAGVQLRLILPAVEIWIDADPARLSQIVLNLVGNGVKYTPPGGHVNVSLSVEGGTAVVRIEDDGVGMSETILPYIFDIFTREGSDPHVGGLGVGLAVASRLAKAHGGSIEARSAGRGKGSLFALRLPTAPQARGAGEAPANL